MASQTMNKNIFSTFGMEDEINASKLKTIQKITGNAGSNDNKLAEFPVLGTKITKEQEKAIYSSNMDATRDTREKVISCALDERSQSFANMSDKTKVAKSLTCTKACRLVTEPYLKQVEHNKTLPENEQKEPQFGVCQREKCTFAHSYDELSTPMCAFDGNCRFLNGKHDRYTKKLIPNTRCRFRHNHETVDEWIKRSKVQRPVLPETSENSRKPRVRNIQSTQEKTGTTIQSTKSSQVVHQAHVKTPVYNNKTRKSRWDEKPACFVDTKGPVITEDYSSSDYSSSDYSSSESSESDDEHPRHRSYPSTPPKHRNKMVSIPLKTSGSIEKIIEVPSKELAAIAIKAAIERGEYNLRVVVV